jgi:hypothetical protein
MIGTEYRVSLDTLTIEVIEDEHGQRFVHVYNRHDIDGKESPAMLFKYGDEKAAFILLNNLAELMGMKIEKV